ncbi:MAG: type II toxin-antitoxin system HicA family toxin [Dehalococcoidia bacterium]|nr:type II toxin-antitoxin system HicA family toxin [Dehalococcoidia bacterium]
MRDLPLISGRECITALQRMGYSVARTRGSHVRLRCPGRAPVTVPLHRELDRGTLRSILTQADITIAEFLGLLEG